MLPPNEAIYNHPSFEHLNNLLCTNELPSSRYLLPFCTYAKYHYYFSSRRIFKLRLPLVQIRKKITAVCINVHLFTLHQIPDHHHPVVPCSTASRLIQVPPGRIPSPSGTRPSLTGIPCVILLMVHINARASRYLCSTHAAAAAARRNEALYNISASDFL